MHLHFYECLPLKKKGIVCDFAGKHRIFKQSEKNGFFGRKKQRADGQLSGMLSFSQLASIIIYLPLKNCKLYF